MRVRQPDWEYTSHGPYLVTRHRSDGSSESTHAAELSDALHRALHWHTLAPDHGVFVIDGWGEFVFGRAAKEAPPDENLNIGTSECFGLLMNAFPHDDLLGGGSSLFSGIEPN